MALRLVDSPPVVNPLSTHQIALLVAELGVGVNVLVAAEAHGYEVVERIRAALAPAQPVVGVGRSSGLAALADPA